MRCQPAKVAATLLLAPLLLIACSDSGDSPAVAAPATQLQSRYVLSSPDSIPEGVAFDPVERAFYATSLQGGSITRVEADGTESLLRPADGRARLGGTKVDAVARRLWVCASGVDGIDSRVWVFDLDSGELANEFLLGALSTEGACNDLALDNAGIAYVSDPANPFIYRLDADSGEGAVFATDPLFNDQTGLDLGLNGLVVLEDGSALIVARFFPPQLIRVALPGADTIGLVNLSGDPLTSLDGLVELEGDVYVVAGNSVSRVRPNADFSAAEVVLVEIMEGLSTATVAEGDLYVIKSEVTNFALERPLNLPFEIFSVDLAVFDQ